MIDTQKKWVVAAIATTDSRWSGSMDIGAACSALGIDRSKVVERDDPGMAVSRSRIAVSRTARPMTILHALAHFATPDLFPPHGSEFCENLLAATEAVNPQAASCLRACFDETGAHYSDDHRRRAVIKSVVQRSVDGTSKVEAVFSSPPQRVEGRFVYDRRAGTITVDDEDFELDRLRYLFRVS